MAVQAALHLLELVEHGGAVGLEQREALLLVALAGADEVGVLAHPPDRHAGAAQPREQDDPAQVLVGVAPVRRRGAADGVEHQPGALVVAQRVGADADSVGSAGDREGFGGGHAFTVRLRVRSTSSACCRKLPGPRAFQRA